MQINCRWTVSFYAPVPGLDYILDYVDYSIDHDYEESLPLVIGNWYTLVLEYRPSGTYARGRVLRGKPSDTGETLPQFACTAPLVYDRLVEGADVDAAAVNVAFGADVGYGDNRDKSWTQFTDLYISYPAIGLLW